MAHRDYKRTPPKRPASGRKKGGSLWPIISLGLVLGLGIAAALLWYLWPRAQDFKKTISAPDLETPVRAANQAPVKPSKDENSGKVDTAPGPDYTFYDILPGNQPAKPFSLEKKRMQWWLQIAALKNASDADTLRAKLSLLNFNAVVQPTPSGEPLLYRVRVGPYASQDAADAAQQTLSENKIDSRALKEAITP